MRHQPRESNLQETGEARDYDSVGEGSDRGNQGAGKNGDQAESN